MTLFEPLFHIIFKYLKPLDFEKLEKLSMYSRYPIKYGLKQNILYNINKRLKYLLGNKYEKFIYYMKKSNAALSGSFVLQCILDEYWDNSDIDIYLVKKTQDNCYMCTEQEEHKFLSHCSFDVSYLANFRCRKEMNDYLKYLDVYDTNKLYCSCVINEKCKCFCHKRKSYIQLCRYSYIENFLYTHFPYDSRHGDDNIDDKDSNKEYDYPLNEIGLIEVATFLDKNHRKIQIMQVKDDIFKFINNFDLNMLKNIYYFDENGDENIYIANINDIKNRKIVINKDINHIHEILKERLEKRIEKYKKRGFTLQS